jgi:cell division control protein 24
MLCCKEVVPERSSKKAGKNSSMLRKDKTASKSGMIEKKRLALKGRIFVSNINRATIIPSDPSGEFLGYPLIQADKAHTDPYATPRLVVAWTVPQRQANGWHEDIEDSFVMIGKSEDQVKRWAEKVMELATAERKRQEEHRLERSRQNGRYSGSERLHQQSSFAPPTPATDQPAFYWPVGQVLDDDDESASGFRSGRTTPSIGSSATYISLPQSRRVQSQQAMPADRQAELRARAMTEDQFGPSMTQWRSQQPMPPPLPRLASAMSARSATSEASFGGPRSGRLNSGSRLGRYDEVDEENPMDHREEYNRYGPPRGMSRAPSQGIPPTIPYPHAPSLRNRSASSPNVYQIPKVSTAPPLPQSAPWQSASTETFSPPPHTLAMSSSSTLVGSGGTAYFNKRMSGSGGKRSSGESHSTETSETSSQQSPATPYGTIPGDPRGPTPVSRQNSHDAVQGMTVLIKVRCGEVSAMLLVAIVEADLMSSIHL